MTANVDLQNLYDRVPLPLQAFFTIRGLEFEFEWYEATFEVLTGVTADPADAFSEIPLWGQSGPGSNPGQGSGLNSSSAVRVIPPGTVVLLEFENNSADPADWYAYFKQWEIAPKALPEPGEL